MIKLKIGQRVKELRANRDNMKQEELAAKVGWDRSFISRIESGKQNLTIENLNLLCSALDITLSDFFNCFNFEVEE